MNLSPLQHGADRIQISGLSVRTVIGIFDEERDRCQELLLHLLLDADVSKAAQSDDIRAALDYKRITKRVVAFTKASRFFLLETLAEKLAELILKEFETPRVTLCIEKPGALRFAQTVSVCITRSTIAGDDENAVETSDLKREKP